MPGRACRCTASASMLVARDRTPGAGRRGPAPPSAIEFLNRDTSLEGVDGVLAYRLHAQGLATRDRTLTEVAASFALQDSPPGAALTAVAARSDEADRLEEALAARELVAVPNPRTAVAILPAADVATYLEALQPPDVRALETVLLRAAPGDFEA